MTMRLCVVSFKECWQDSAGTWWSYGGFPMQMAGVSSLFDETTLVIVRGRPRSGGIPLQGIACTVPLRSPSGADLRRKLSVLSQLPYYVRTIARHVREADVVHIPAPGDMPLLGMLIALALRKRLIVRYGSSWTTTSQTTMTHKFTRACMRRFAGGRNVMLATGEGAGAPAARMRWVFSTAITATELRHIQPYLNRGLSAPPRLVYAGRLSPEKGVAVLVRAMAALRDARMSPMPVLTLVGDGPEREALAALVRDVGCADVIRFAGHCNREDLSRHLQESDVCVQPSLTEGFSKAWLDAMAHGLPVVTSDVGAAAAVVGAGDAERRGWLVAPGDAGQLTDTIRRVLGEARDWPTLRRRCRAYVEGRTLEAWTQAIAEACAAQWKVAVVGGKLRS
jgi:glycosyltransferase involved in cell wall biosynthesis